MKMKSRGFSLIETVIAMVILAGALIVLSLSGGSSPTGAAPAVPTLAVPNEPKPALAAEHANEEPANAEKTLPAPAPRAEPTAHASAPAVVPSSRKPATPPKPKSVTRVESAGF